MPIMAVALVLQRRDHNGDSSSRRHCVRVLVVVMDATFSMVLNVAVVDLTAARWNTHGHRTKTQQCLT